MCLSLPSTPSRIKDKYLSYLALLLGLLTAVLLWQPVQAQATDPGTETDVRTYTVVPGDTLFVIAQQVGVPMETLITHNGISDPNQLEVGQVLLIPNGDGSAGSPAAANPATGDLAAADFAVVRAQPGDTVATIAAAHGQTTDQLAAINQLTPADRLFPGQPLLLPRAAAMTDPLRFGAVDSVRLPERLVQGRTGMVVVTTARPLELAGTWNGLPISFIPQQDNGLVQFAYLPVPALIAPSSYWVTVSYTATNGLKLNQTWAVPVGEGPYESQEINLPPDRGTLLAPEIVQAELEKVTEVWSVRTPTLAWTLPFTRPISAEYPTTSPFGTRRSYNGGPYSSYHAGQDFGAPEGIPVLAPADGVVALADALNVRGNAVIVDHGGGVFTGYWHLSELKVTPGQVVHAGDVLGISGNTGLSTGAHLHWELRIYGVAVDPMQFFDEPLAPPL